MADRPTNLHLHEEILLLALRDEKGTIESRAGMYQFALGGAIFAELLLEGKLRLTGEGRKTRVEAAGRGKLHDDLLDECLELVRASKRSRRPQEWVSRFANLRRLKHRVAEGLCRKGILKDSRDKVLLIFTRKIYPTVDPVPERSLRARIRRAVRSESRSLKPRTAILLALAQATGLLKVLFDRHELKERKRRLEAIRKGALIGSATSEAVRAAQAAQAAAMVAISAAVTASTVVHH